MLTIRADVYASMIAAAYDVYPEEMCGLLAGGTDPVVGPARFVACRNTTRSGRVFEIHPLDYQRAEDEADEHGLTLTAVVHSHTHTEPYPSPTDVGVAGQLGPLLRWIVVGLKRPEPEIRSYRIEDGTIVEEPLLIA